MNMLTVVFQVFIHLLRRSNARYQEHVCLLNGMESASWSAKDRLQTTIFDCRKEQGLKGVEVQVFGQNPKLHWL